MGIFDVFTGAPAKEAAGQQRALFDQTKTQGNADISTGLTGATGAVTGGAAAARSDLTGGYNGATGAINSGADSALGYLGQGYNGAQGYLNQAGGAYSPLAALGTKYGAGTSTYLDSLGINGAEGNARASAAFAPSQAYNFNLDQGLEAINRSRNARGMVNSGNTDRDAQTYGAGLASNEYKGWQDRLADLINPELSATAGAASGQAGVYGQQANMANNFGTNQAGVASGRGSMLSDLSSRYGINMAGVDTGEGNTLAGLQTGAAGQKVGLAQSIMQPYAQSYKNEADAQMAGSGNLWNLGMQGAKLGVGAYGGSQGWFGGGPTFSGDGSQSSMGGGAGGGVFGKPQSLFGW